MFPVRLVEKCFLQKLALPGVQDITKHKDVMNAHLKAVKKYSIKKAYPEAM